MEQYVNMRTMVIAAFIGLAYAANTPPRKDGLWTVHDTVPNDTGNEPAGTRLNGSAHTDRVAHMTNADRILAQRDSFTPIDGASLRGKLDSAISKGRAAQSKFWVGYQFEVRPGVCVDAEFTNDNGRLRARAAQANRSIAAFSPANSSRPARTMNNGTSEGRSVSDFVAVALTNP